MKAEIIAVGTELLLGDVVNTNAAEIARMLSEIGIGVYHQAVVGDNRERLADAFRTALRRVDLVIACGGLGPTEDDLTRETLASVLDLPLHRDDGWACHLEKRFERRRPGGTISANNYRQAMVPEGATLLPNSRGTAPGIYLEHEGVIVALIPGPPGEMRTLMQEQVLPRLTGTLSSDDREAVLVSRVLRIAGIGESRAAELLESLLAEQTNPTVAPLAQPAELHLRITAHAPDTTTAHRMIDSTAEQIRAVLGDAVYGEGEITLEHAVGILLTEQNKTVALAESCTGGLVGHRLTRVPGSSRYFLGGIVAYSYELKSSLLDVDPELIAREGAVSDAVARAMVRGVRSLCRSDTAVAITGIAGPGGATELKSVGLTFVAIADEEGEECHRYEFPGNREEVTTRASQTALELLRRRLLSSGDGMR